LAVAAAVGGEEIEKVPLRHQRDEFALCRQMGEVDQPDALVSDLQR